MVRMFDRTLPGRLDDSKIKPNLHRFNNDEYATKYLVQCYNPEFKIKVVFPKSITEYGEYAVGASRRSFTTKEAVF